MTCRYCGTDLPEEAMFCGECGRSVAPRPVPVATAAPVVRPAPEPDPVLEPDPALVEIVLDDEGSREEMPSISDLFAVREHDEPEIEAEEAPAAAPAAPLPAVAPVPAAAAVAPAVPAPPADELVDLEATRLTGPSQSGERFVLQFSTGESVTVFGTGIIGRNPTPEPSEYFDQRVTIFDPTKSVSKTHLEFGQTAGAFWINDRYSGNGTGVRQPDAPRVSCEPGKRYLLARGSRVDIGEQFFIVS